jgi:hypothetical protein
MTTWAGFWIGLGIALFGAFLDHGIVEASKAAILIKNPNPQHVKSVYGKILKDNER